MKEFSLLQNWWALPVWAIACYFVGCFNFAVLISRLKGKDVTKMGSGNPGTMNMSREFGLKIGLATFFCDALKGGVPAIIAHLIYRDTLFSNTAIEVSDFFRYYCGLCVVIGHIFPITMRFKGGKGIASTLGLFWGGLSCENPWLILIGFVWLVCVVLFIYLTEWGSLGSLFGVTLFSVFQVSIFIMRYAENALNAYLVCLYMFILAINVLTWWAHRHNLARLFSGEEHRTSIKKLAARQKEKQEK